MATRLMKGLALAGVLAVHIANTQSAAAGANDVESEARMANEMVAMQFNYFDELDLKRFESLETEFGQSSRVLVSLNAVRFGPLDVRAKLVVPRSDAPRRPALLHGKSPEPVRIMLDYALVSCRNGCRVGIRTEPGMATVQFSASHDEADFLTKSPYAARARTASMVLIEGKGAREAIRQLNESRRAQITLIAAVHGAARFEFDTSVRTETK